MTVTHLRKKTVIDCKYNPNNSSVTEKTTTDYFCGRAKKYSISTRNPSMVTCDACIEGLYTKKNKGEKNATEKRNK